MSEAAGLREKAVFFFPPFEGKKKCAAHFLQSTAMCQKHRAQVMVEIQVRPMRVFQGM